LEPRLTFAQEDEGLDFCKLSHIDQAVITAEPFRPFVRGSKPRLAASPG
jgi:hypothetical protein